MRKISYKCKKCGGNININKSKTSLACEYCNTKYDNFVEVEETELSKFMERLEINSYVCSCGQKYNHFNTSKKDGVCPFCDKKNDIKESQIVNSVILKDYNPISIGKKYASMISNIKDFLPSEFYNLEFEFKYIKTEIYDGIIDINATSKDGKNINKKYVIFDMIVPDSPNFCNGDKIEIIKSKVECYKIFNRKSNLIHLQLKDLEVGFNKENIISSIENACVKEFKSLYPDVNNLSVNTNLDVSYNNYFPIYFNNFVYEGSEYHNFAIGCKMKGVSDVSFYLDLPELSSEQEKLFSDICSRHKNLMKRNLIISIIFALIILGSLFIFPSFYLVIFLALFCFFFAYLFFWEKKKLNILKSDIKLLKRRKVFTDDDFFKEMVSKENSIVSHIDWS